MSPSKGSVDWEEVNDLLSRCVIRGESMTITRYRFAPFGRFPLHRHEQEQFVFCVSGSIVFIIEGMGRRLSQGETLLIEPFKVHEALADANGAEVLSVVAPARADNSLEILE